MLKQGYRGDKSILSTLVTSKYSDVCHLTEKKSLRVMIQTSKIGVQTVRREVEKLKKNNMGRLVPLSYENGEGAEGREKRRTEFFFFFF